MIPLDPERFGPAALDEWGRAALYNCERFDLAAHEAWAATKTRHLRVVAKHFPPNRIYATRQPLYSAAGTPLPGIGVITAYSDTRVALLPPGCDDAIPVVPDTLRDVTEIVRAHGAAAVLGSRA